MINRQPQLGSVGSAWSRVASGEASNIELRVYAGGYELTNNHTRQEANYRPSEVVIDDNLFFLPF